MIAAAFGASLAFAALFAAALVVRSLNTGNRLRLSVLPLAVVAHLPTGWVAMQFTGWIRHYRRGLDHARCLETVRQAPKDTEAVPACNPYGLMGPEAPDYTGLIVYLVLSCMVFVALRHLYLTRFEKGESAI